MKVLQVVTDRDRRGAQVFAADLAVGLENLGATVQTVALTKGSHGDLLPIDALGPSRRAPSTFLALRRRARQCDVVIAHGSSTLLACAIALIGARTPFVYRQISDPTHWAATWSRRLRVALMVRRAASIVVLSSSVAQVFGRHYRLRPEQMTEIPNAVPGAGFAPATAEARLAARARLDLPADARIVLYLGALADEKGVDMAIEAIADVATIVLLIVGDGPARNTLELLANRQAAGRVVFAGAVSDARTALSAADLLVLPSRGGDSMPAVLIEAGLCGLATVATPVGAIADVVVDGQTGRVVPIGDQNQLRGAVAELCNDETLRRRYGAAAELRCRDRFTIEATAPTWSELLRSVVR